MSEGAGSSASNIIYRIGVKPKPMYRPFLSHGDGRYDDPEPVARFHVLYTGDRQACFLEKLGTIVPAVTDLTDTTDQGVTDDWLDKFGIASVPAEVLTQLGPQLDLASLAGIGRIDSEITNKFESFEGVPLSLSSVRTRNRQATKALAGWAYLHEYASIRYECRYKSGLYCYAIICDSGEIPPDLHLRAQSSSISPADHDLVIAARELGVPVLGAIP